MKRPVLSVVTTVFKSEMYLSGFLDQVLKVLEDMLIEDFELIFVLDGLTDHSKAYLLNQKKSLPQIKIIELSKNFGHHYAISAGLKYSWGDLVYLTDCDLEVSPEVLKEFQEIMNEGLADVVFGVQEKRKGAFLERVFGSIFWKVFNYLSDTQIPLNTVTERLMTRSYVDALLSMGDRNLFLAGMMHWIGYEQLPCRVNKVQRSGPSTYTFRKRLDLLVEAITSFSEKPLTILFRIGGIILLFSVFFSVILILRKIFYPETVLLGFTSVMILLFFTIGSILSALGIIGIYISRILNQVKNRPLYWVKKVYD